eukprot:scpid81609/ scgid16664/ Putative peptidyl-tRNA hydrolase PTRHD1; Peptidyl-tRNA hydrolase domain-containing protein 1
MSGLVQYVVVRGDLLRSLSWPVGAVIAQGCHASSAVLHRFGSDQNVHSYFEHLESMHKVVLEIQDEASLRTLAERLTEGAVDHHLWIEQPEGTPTALACKPYPKPDVQKYFKGLKLFK